jgi:transcriptional regulator
MYVPAHFAGTEDDARAFLDALLAADLVTHSPATGLAATFLPLAFTPDAGTNGSLRGHLARNNPQWQSDATTSAFVIAHGVNGYISPSWYAAKPEHGRVVPTWNYVTAHVYGQLVVHDDVTWLEQLVRELTERHEASRTSPWSVDDAPRSYIDGQLRAIVGVELIIERVEFKAKMSQNRPEADVQGVIDGLRSDDESALAEQVVRFAAVRREGEPHVGA